jgi:hypothetical protein
MGIWGGISTLAAIVVSTFYGPAPNEPPVASAPFDRPYVIASLTTPSRQDVIRDGSEVEVWFDRIGGDPAGLRAAF